MEHNEEDWSVECSDDEKYEVDAKVTRARKYINLYSSSSLSIS